MFKKENPKFFYRCCGFFSISPRLEAIFGLKICKLLQLIQRPKEQKAFYFQDGNTMSQKNTNKMLSWKEPYLIGMVFTGTH